MRRSLASGSLVAALTVAAAVTITQLAGAGSKDEARQHLRAGVALFQKQDFEGALAEFTRSYDAMHTAAALQNIALCHTRLQRYVAAIDTLEKLQREFDSTLSKQDREAIEKALKDLSPFVGTLVLRVAPPDAHVTVDDRPVDPARFGQPLRLGPGEHRIAGSARSHAPVAIVVSVEKGEQKQVELTLPATAADVSILASDPAAAIAIDREAKAYGAWSGSLTPATHLVQVYKPGHKAFATYFSVRAGDRLELNLPLGEPTPATNAEASATTSLPYSDSAAVRVPDEPPPRGAYGLISATNMAVLQSPDAFTPDSKGDATGGFFGLRAGYRFNSYFAAEAVFESGGQSIDGSRQTDPNVPASRSSYELTTSRYGGNVRLLAGGRSIRFSGTFGVGAVHHTLTLDGTRYKGLNSYFGLEAGPQVNMGKAILELALQITLEGTTSVRADGVRAYTDHTIVPQAGVGLRVGYGEWGRW